MHKLCYLHSKIHFQCHSGFQGRTEAQHNNRLEPVGSIHSYGDFRVKVAIDLLHFIGLSKTVSYVVSHLESTFGEL